MARGAVADREAARDEVVLRNFTNFANVESAKDVPPERQLRSERFVASQSS